MKQNTELLILSIVAIVAIVGIVVMILSVESASENVGGTLDAVGQTARVGTERTALASLSGTCTATPTSGATPLTVSFKATATGGSGKYVGYNWDFLNNGIGNMQGNTASYAYKTTGIFAPKVTIYDSKGQTAKINCPKITAVATRPLTGTCTATPTSGATPLTVSFKATATGGSGKYVGYNWDFLNNGIGNMQGNTASYAYKTTGIFAPKVTIYDSKGQTAKINCPKINTENTKTPAALCKLVHASGDPTYKLNIVIVSSNFTNNIDFNRVITDILNSSDKSYLFNVEPFAHHTQDINIYSFYLPNTSYVYVYISNNYSMCSGFSNNNLKYLLDNITAYCQMSALDVNQLIILDSNSFRSNAPDMNSLNSININSKISLISSSFYNKYLPGLASWIILHELGHSLGGLGDEYYDECDKTYLPTVIQNNNSLPSNIDKEGCPKWCSGYLNTSSPCYTTYMDYKQCLLRAQTDLEYDACVGIANDKLFNLSGLFFITDCEMGVGCRQGTGCYFQAHGVSYFRPDHVSIMSGAMAYYGYGAIGGPAIDDMITGIVSYKKNKEILTDINLSIINYTGSRYNDMVTYIIEFKTTSAGMPIWLYSDSLKASDGHNYFYTIYKKNSGAFIPGTYLLQLDIYAPIKDGIQDHQSSVLVFNITLPHVQKNYQYVLNLTKYTMT